MNTGFRILVPLDGSPQAEEILLILLPVARQRSVHLTLISVVPRNVSASPAEEYLVRARSLLFRHDIQAETMVDWGDPGRTVALAASPDEWDLIAMSTHGRTGFRRVLVGSVAWEVVRHAVVPVIVAPPESRMAGWKHLIVGLDGSVSAEEVLGPAGRLAGILGATVHLVAVEEEGSAAVPETDALLAGESTPQYLRRIAGSLKGRGIPAMVASRRGRAAGEIVRYAANLRAGLIALGTHGRAGLGRLLMGSVAEEVVAAAPCPVLLKRSLGPRSPGTMHSTRKEAP